MEQSNHSAEVIKLGKKLVKELRLSDRRNTLSTWMAHYIAELMKNIELEPSGSKKRIELEMECRDTIMKLWANRNNMPDEIRPLSNLSDVLSVLNSLQKRKKKKIWSGFVHDNSNPGWSKFIRQIDENYNDIIAVCLSVNLAKDLLNKEKEWLEFPEFLSKEEKNVIEELDDLITSDESYLTKYSMRIFESEDDIEDVEVSDTNKKPIDRQAEIEKKLSSLINKQLEYIKELKMYLEKNVQKKI